MRKFIIAVVVFLYTNCTYAQRLVLESKEGLLISTHMVFSTGKSTTTKGSFSFPSLLSNFESGYGFEITYFGQFKPKLNVGISYSNTFFSDWQFDERSNVFNNAEAGLQSVAVNVIWQSSFHEQGSGNKFRYSGGVAPGVYLVSVKIPEYVVSSTKILRPGIMVNGRIEYAIWNSLAISISGGYQIVSVKSIVFQEKSFQWLQVGAGVVFRLNRNQNYLQTDYE